MSDLYQAQLHVGHAMEALPSLLGQHMAGEADSVEAAHKAYRESQRQALEEACAGSGVDTSHVHQREGAPEKVIPVLADDIRADLLVLGTVNRRGLKRAVIGSTAEAILDQVGCDVLAVKPEGFVSDYEKLKDE